MIRPIHLIFEFLSYGLLAACLWHAARQERHRMVELAAALVYGVFLEWMTLRQLEAYQYGRFLVMFDGAPLTIGVGWAVIIYSAMELSDRLALPEAARPWLDGLLALNIDLSMDAIAIRLGMWHWGFVGLDEQWFGVPWVNFWAWFIVVTSFSACIRGLRPWRRSRIGAWLYVPAALLLSVMVLAVTNWVYRSILAPNDIALLGIVLLVGSGLYIVWNVRPTVLHPGPPNPVVIAVPLTFHGLYFTAGIHYGFYAETPALAIIGAAMLFGGLAVHLWPWWAEFRGRHSSE